MTYEEFASKHLADGGSARDRVVWEAAQKSEREECAKLCDGRACLHGKFGTCGESYAASIRARSNLELTGGALMTDAERPA